MLLQADALPIPVRVVHVVVLMVVVVLLQKECVVVLLQQVAVHRLGHLHGVLPVVRQLIIVAQVLLQHVVISIITAVAALIIIAVHVLIIVAVIVVLLPASLLEGLLVQVAGAPEGDKELTD